MARWLFYLWWREDGESWCAFHGEASVEEHGGLKALEAKIRKRSLWYTPIGELELQPENPDLWRFLPLLEAWVEKGAHTIKGALNPGLSEVTISSELVRRYFVYKFCEKDGREQVCVHSEAEVKEYGGVEALELAMGNHTSWYYPIGTLLIPGWVDEPGEVAQVPTRRIKPLVDAWLALGSPWKPGKHARDLANPPKGHPLADESEETRHQ